MLHRWTGFVYLAPRRYCDPAAAADLDIEAWSRRFDWRADAWNGWRDRAKPVADTIADARGDCEDYALVAASWALARNLPVRLAFCLRGVVPRHVVAVTDRRVYSSGAIHPGPLSDYLAATRYERALQRWVAR